MIRHAAVYCDFADKLSILDWDNLNKHCIIHYINDNANDIQTPDHHALIPTGIVPPYLPKDDKLIYRLIVERMLEALAPNCQKKTTRIEAVCGQVLLESKVTEIRHFGWRLIRNSEDDREENEAKPTDAIPVFAVEEAVRIAGWNLMTLTTQPKPLHTEATLLSEIEAASLGTVETRAEIIESLMTAGYIEYWGQHLVPTEKGMSFYHTVKKMLVADTGLIGDLEKILKDVGRKNDADNFMEVFDIHFKYAVEEILTTQNLYHKG
jgi:DNA topoisomerase-3